MRTIALDVFAIIAAAVFVIMMIAVMRHRSSDPAQTARGSALAEYLFALVPWLIMGASVLPSLRRIVAGG